MLPGFRFLFAATMLSMSLLIFGLGAAALLRAAHESFASNSSWRATPEVPFAQRPETMPVLATLRVEPNSFDRTNAQAPLTTAPADQPMVSAEPARSETARNDQVAALRPAETQPTEAAKPAELPTPASAPENPPAVDAVSPPVLKQAGGDARYVACVRFNPKKNSTDYAGTRELAAEFLVGRFDHFVEIPKDLTDTSKNPCAGAAYAPFPELQTLPP